MPKGTIEELEKLLGQHIRMQPEASRPEKAGGYSLPNNVPKLLSVDASRWPIERLTPPHFTHDMLAAEPWMVKQFPQHYTQKLEGQTPAYNPYPHDFGAYYQYYVHPESGNTNTLVSGTANRMLASPEEALQIDIMNPENLAGLKGSLNKAALLDFHGDINDPNVFQTENTNQIGRLPEIPGRRKFGPNRALGPLVPGVDRYKNIYDNRCGGGYCTDEELKEAWPGKKKPDVQEYHTGEQGKYLLTPGPSTQVFNGNIPMEQFFIEHDWSRPRDKYVDKGKEARKLGPTQKVTQKLLEDLLRGGKKLIKLLY